MARLPNINSGGLYTTGQSVLSTFIHGSYGFCFCLDLDLNYIDISKGLRRYWGIDNTDNIIGSKIKIGVSYNLNLDNIRHAITRGSRQVCHEKIRLYDGSKLDAFVTYEVIRKDDQMCYILCYICPHINADVVKNSTIIVKQDLPFF